MSPLVLFTLLTLVIAALLLYPLLKRRKTDKKAASFDDKAYRDQWAELDREQAEGVLSSGEAESMRAEIGRRMLEAETAWRKSQEDPKEDVFSRKKARNGMIAAVTILLLLVAYTAYDRLGSPDQPGAPQTARKVQEEKAEYDATRQMVEGLASKLHVKDNDAEGWMKLSRALRVMGEYDRALEAVRHAITLQPKAVAPLIVRAEAELARAGKDAPLPDDFIATMREVLALNGDTPQALYYVGQAEAEAGRPQEARRLWTRLLELTPKDSPDRTMLEDRLASLPR